MPTLADAGISVHDTVPEGAPIGLIAGGGSLPAEVACGMRERRHAVICASLAGWADRAALEPICIAYKNVGLLRINQWIRLFHRHGVRHAVMIGKVPKERIYDRFHLFRYIPDWRSLRIWFVRTRGDRRTANFLRALAQELECGGLTVIGAAPYVPGSLAVEGVMTRRQPSHEVVQDIEFAWPLLRKVNELLIGQCLACKDREIIAVEAVEGTDRTIERAGALCPRGGWVLCKATNPQQDLRLDLPAVGVQTIENLHKHGALALALEAGRTLMVEKEKLLQRADQLGIAVIGRK